MIHFQPIRQNQLRRACDRCHRSKSKCKRDNDDEPCQRCIRANATCISGPPATSRRRTRISPPQASDQTPSIDTEPSQMDVDVFDSNGVFNKQHFIPSPPTLPYHTPESPSLVAVRLDASRLGLIEGPSNIEEPYLDLISLLERLSGLNIRLMRYLNTNPKVNTPDTQTQLGDKQFDIEDVFHIMQLFIETINQICSRLPPPQNNAAKNTLEDKLQPFSLDAASELLMYSCYLRLIETYDRILRLIKTFITNRAPNSATLYPFKMPNFTVGSFSLPSKPETQSIFFVNSMDAMMARAKELVAEVTFPKQTSGYRGDFQSFGGTSLVIVPDLARNVIRTRENALIGMLEDLKKSILQRNL